MTASVYLENALICETKAGTHSKARIFFLRKNGLYIKVGGNSLNLNKKNEWNEYGPGEFYLKI